MPTTFSLIHASLQLPAAIVTILGLLLAAPAAHAAAPSATLVEAEDTEHVKYAGQGWQTADYADKHYPQVHGGKTRRSSTAGDTASLTFAGRSISVIFRTGVYCGIATFSIDGKDYPSVSLYNNAYADPEDLEWQKWMKWYGSLYTEVVVATDLAPGEHTLQVRVTGKRQFAWGKSGDRVEIDAFRYGDFAFGTVQGQVVDPDGDPITRGTVKLSSQAATLEVPLSNDGLYALSGIVPGVYDVTVSADGYEMQTHQAVTIKAGQAAAEKFTLPEAPGHYLYDKVFLPRPGTPALRRKGDSFTINVKAAADARDWSASLLTPYNAYRLKVSSPAYDLVHGWTMTAAIPQDIPEELYDLKVAWNGGARSDTQPRAVKVISEFKKAFYFIQTNDPQEDWNKFEQVVSEINLINPQFVIDVGDNINGWQVPDRDWQQMLTFRSILDKLRTPSFCTPGNHCGSPGWTLPMYMYKQLIGQRVQSFDYGPCHFTMLDNAIFNFCNAWEFDIGGYYAARERWAKADLAAHQASPLKFLCVHVGYDMFTDMPNNFWYKAMPAPKWIDTYKVNWMLYSHWGQDKSETFDSPTPTRFVQTRDVQADGAYRLFRVDGDRVVSCTYDGSPAASITAGSLSVAYAPANDGKSTRITATVTNKLRERFEDGLVRLLMPRGQYAITAGPGTITQQVDSDDGACTIVYVALPIAPEATTAVTVARQ